MRNYTIIQILLKLLTGIFKLFTWAIKNFRKIFFAKLIEILITKPIFFYKTYKIIRVIIKIVFTSLGGIIIAPFNFFGITDMISDLFNWLPIRKVAPSQIDAVKDMATATKNKVAEKIIESDIPVVSDSLRSKYKNNDKLELYYTDTDSIFIDKSPSELIEIFGDVIGNKLGQLKLECSINKAVFIAPKAYFLETDEGLNIVKIKGLNTNVISDLTSDNIINFETFVDVLKKDYEVIVSQNKSLKNLLNGSLDIIQQTYSIKHNDNKRNLVYNKNNILIGTQPKKI